MASVIANEFTEAASDLYLSALSEIGLLLFAVTLLLNVIARLLVWRVQPLPGGAGRTLTRSDAYRRPQADRRRRALARASLRRSARARRR